MISTVNISMLQRRNWGAGRYEWTKPNLSSHDYPTSPNTPADLYVPPPTLTSWFSPFEAVPSSRSHLWPHFTVTWTHTAPGLCTTFKQYTIFLSKLCAQRGTRTHSRAIKSRMLYWVSQAPLNHFHFVSHLPEQVLSSAWESSPYPLRY